MPLDNRGEGRGNRLVRHHIERIRGKRTHPIVVAILAKFANRQYPIVAHHTMPAKHAKVLLYFLVVRVVEVLVLNDQHIGMRIVKGRGEHRVDRSVTLAIA